MDLGNIARALDPFGSTLLPLVQEAKKPLSEEEKEKLGLGKRALRWGIGEIPELAAISMLSGPVGALTRLAKLKKGAQLAKWATTGAAYEAGPRPLMEGEPVEEVAKKAPARAVGGAALWGTTEIGISALGKLAVKLFNRGTPLKEFPEIRKALEQRNYGKALEKTPDNLKPQLKRMISEEAERRGITSPFKEVLEAEPLVPEKVLETPREAAPDDIFLSKIGDWLKGADVNQIREVMEVGRQTLPKELNPLEKSWFYKKVWMNPMWNKWLSPVFDKLHAFKSRSREFTSEAEELLRPYKTLNEGSKKRVHKFLMDGYNNQKDFTVKELQSLGLSEAEAEGYQAYRNTLDHMYWVTIPQILKDGGVPELDTWIVRKGKRVVGTYDNKKMAITAAKQLGGKAELREGINTFLNKHHRNAYFPAYRFGKYIFTVERNKNVLWSGATDSREEAELLAGWLKNEYKGANIKHINLDQIAHRYPDEIKDLFMIMHHVDDMKSFLRRQGLDDNLIEDFEKIVGDITVKKWSAGKFAPRYDIPGYSPDLERAIDRYITTVPRAFLRRYGKKELYDSVQGLPIRYRNMGREWLDKQFETPKDVWGRHATGFMYHWFLGFKPAYALRNITQRLTTTFNRSIAEAGNVSDGMKYWKDAQFKSAKYFKGFWSKGSIFRSFDKQYEFMRDSISKIDDEYTQKIMRRLLREKNILSEIKYEWLPETTTGKMGKYWNKFLEKSNMFVLHSDASNRIHAALNAIEIAKKRGLGLQDGLEFARGFVARTQWVYRGYARPEYLKGPITRPLFVFKSWFDNYIHSFVDLYHKNPRAASAQLAIMLGLAGAEGIPFIKDVETIVDEVGKREGWTWWPDRKRYWRANTPSVIREGVPAYIGIPGSWTFGFADVLPGQFPPYKLAGQMWEGLQALHEESIPLSKKLYYLSPTLLKHAIAAATDAGMIPQDMYGKQRYTLEDIKRLPKNMRIDALEWYNKIPKKWPLHQKALYALGFSCLNRKEIQNYYQSLKQQQSYESRAKKNIHISIAKAVAEGDKDHAQELFRYAIKKGYKLDKDTIKRYLFEFIETQ